MCKKKSMAFLNNIVNDKKNHLMYHELHVRPLQLLDMTVNVMKYLDKYCFKTKE